MANLPLELIFHIISFLLPDNPRVLVEPSHPATKALLACTLVCRATYPVAANLLRQQCIFIDNDRRLRNLIYTIESTQNRTRSAAASGAETTNTQPPRPVLRTCCALRDITSLYLAPFRAGYLDDQPTAIWVRELFFYVCGTLRKLVVDMPLRSLRPAEDHLDVRRILREAFSALAGLEELVSVRDDLYLDTCDPARAPHREQPVWTHWPRLRRLALYGVHADERFWRHVRDMGAALEAVVLTRADGLTEVCMKSFYFGRTDAPAPPGEDVGVGKEASGSGTDRPGRPGPIKVVLANVQYCQPDGLAGTWRWRKIDPDMEMRVMTYDVPTSFYGDEAFGELCQNWAKAGTLMGTIWDWEGTLVEGDSAAESTQVFELEG